MKKSAELFLYGAGLSLLGFVVFIASSMAFQSESRHLYGDTQGASVGMWIGIAIGLIGIILLTITAYRALAKIDALSVPETTDEERKPVPDEPGLPTV